MWSLKKKFSPLCRFYGMHDETVAHVSECPKPAQKEYSPNNMAKVIHWKLCGKWGFPSTQNGICISQSKHWSQKSVKYCEIFRYREVNNCSIIGHILPWLTRKKNMPAYWPIMPLWLLYWKERKKAKIIVTGSLKSNTFRRWKR